MANWKESWIGVGRDDYNPAEFSVMLIDGAGKVRMRSETTYTRRSDAWRAARRVRILISRAFDNGDLPIDDVNEEGGLDA